LQVAGVERYKDKRDKDMYSHIVESAEYAMVGEGEGYELVARPESQTRYRPPKVIRSMQ